MSVFNTSFFRYFTLFCILFISLDCKGQTDAKIKSYGYSVFCAPNTSSEKWAGYLFEHLHKRATDKKIVVLNQKGNNFREIRINVDPSLGHDYAIKNSTNELILEAKDDRTILWLIYQLIKELSVQDDRITGSDLPPPTIDFTSKTSDFDYKYREPHFSANLNPDYAGILGTYNLDTDWGLWGHGLKKTLSNADDPSLYAKIDGNINRSQFCFSSKSLYKQLEEYISDQFGDGTAHQQYFMIMPNDNGIVCMCESCKEHGNTPDNTTPALSKLLIQVANKYPLHYFFTSAYRTTVEAPGYTLPDNVGVIVSTIDLPKGVSLENNKSQKFVELLSKWKRCTSNIYIWDYASNFDDYMTPIPVLYGLQKQLTFFKENGVKGVFLNASGYDYCPFDDMKSFVSGALMMNTAIEVDTLCHNFFLNFYPKSGQVLSDYYLTLEKKFAQKNRPYDLYGGFHTIISEYLDLNDFVAFYKKLDSLIAMAEGDERQRLEKLKTALSYTRLQVAYHEGSRELGYAVRDGSKLTYKYNEIMTYVEELERHTKHKDFKIYKEVEGMIPVYTQNWRNLLNNREFRNQLVGKELKVLSRLDSDYQNSSQLNDGVKAFDKDYHKGWLLCSIDDLHIEFDTEGINEVQEVAMSFLFDNKHRIYLPDRVEMYKNGQLYTSQKPNKNSSETKGVTTLRLNANLSNADKVSIKIYRNKDEKGSFACDEIQLQ